MELLPLLNFQMTHLSRSDSDKMLADMAEGSADYGDPDDQYADNNYDDDDMSGSGDHSPCKFHDCLILFYDDINCQFPFRRSVDACGPTWLDRRPSNAYESRWYNRYWQHVANLTRVSHSSVILVTCDFV